MSTVCSEVYFFAYLFPHCVSFQLLIVKEVTQACEGIIVTGASLELNINLDWRLVGLCFDIYKHNIIDHYTRLPSIYHTLGNY